MILVCVSLCNPHKPSIDSLLCDQRHSSTFLRVIDPPPRVDVLGKLHIDVLLRPRVLEQNAVFTRLLDHAHMQVVPLRPLLSGFCVPLDQACEEGLRVVAAVPRNKVHGPRRGNGRYGEPKAPLDVN